MFNPSSGQEVGNYLLDFVMSNSHLKKEIWSIIVLKYLFLDEILKIFKFESPFVENFKNNLFSYPEQYENFQNIWTWEHKTHWFTQFLLLICTLDENNSPKTSSKMSFPQSQK